MLETATVEQKDKMVKTTTQPRQTYITRKDFKRRYLSREDCFKYEWIDGKIEKTKRTMNPNQFYIWRNMVNFLTELEQKQGEKVGMFPMEADIFLQKVLHRIPDICYFTLQQIENAADNEVVIPEFVVEVISESDNINRVNRKINEYFTAGVKIVWHIFPELKEVYVYNEGGKTIKVCRDDDICSAETVIEGFAMTVNQIFRRDKKEN